MTTQATEKQHCNAAIFAPSAQEEQVNSAGNSALLTTRTARGYRIDI